MINVYYTFAIIYLIDQLRGFYLFMLVCICCMLIISPSHPQRRMAASTLMDSLAWSSKIYFSSSLSTRWNMTVGSGQGGRSSTKVQCSHGKLGGISLDGNALGLSFDLKDKATLNGFHDTSHVSLASEDQNLRAMKELKPTAANSSPFTPLGFLERAATVYGSCISLIYNETKYTWSETYDRCLRVASALSSMDIGKCNVVSVLAPNIPSTYELHFAVPMTGAILNNINTRLDAKTVSILLQHSGSKLLLVDCLLKPVALEAISLFPANAPKPRLVLITDEYETELTNAVTTPFCMSYEDLVSKGDSKFEMVLPESEWEPMALNYTSGTTSAPKGVVLSHRGLFTLIVDLLLEWVVPKHAIYLWTLPMFHANGWCFPYGMAAVGGTNICVRKIGAAAIYELIEKHGVTHMCGAPVVLNMLSNFKKVEEPLSRTVHVMTAGAPPPAAVLHRIESLGFIVTHAYGLTETSGPTVACSWKPEWNNLPAETQSKMKARQGVRTLLLTKVDVINSVTGAAVPRDGATVGEVVLRGNAVMLGYYKDRKSTEESISNGWFYTGDIGVMHPDGYLEIKDRSKDVIISGGENISSVEVESVLFTHPCVNEAAVVARPNEYWGETPCAFINLKGEQVVTNEELIEFCKAKMPRYMVPKTVVFMDELPKTSTGKVQKYLLRELAMALGPDMTQLKSPV